MGFLQNTRSMRNAKPAVRRFASLVCGMGLLLSGFAAQVKAQETIGGGSIASPAVGPKPSYGIGGAGMTLVKNWHFGQKGTIKNYADMSDNFFYHDQFGTIGNGTNYGAVTVAPDAANALFHQPIEGDACPPVRQFTDDSLKTFLVPLYGATKVIPYQHNAGCGSFMAKWKLPNGGSLLGQDIVWETRVRYATPPYFWFAIWTAGNKWNRGAEQDLVESFGYDNGGPNKNYDGRYWHSNAVSGQDVTDYGDWNKAMSSHGLTAFDATKYHTWTWLYKKDNSYAMYVDGVMVQSGKDCFWTYGSKKTDEPIDMDFLFDGGWGHTQIDSVNRALPASAFEGKFYEWNYSRVYLRGEALQPVKAAPK